jgi:hypothetical protein
MKPRTHFKHTIDAAAVAKIAQFQFECVELVPPTAIPLSVLGQGWKVPGEMKPRGEANTGTSSASMKRASSSGQGSPLSRC